MRKHYVVYKFPGTDQNSSHQIDRWDIKKAVERSAAVFSASGARPYGFFFHTPASPGLVRKKSGFHYLGGKTYTYDQAKDNGDPKEAILIINMRRRFPIACINTNSHRTVMPFEENDVIVDLDGDIVERGDTKKRIAYRKRVLDLVHEAQGAN